MGKVFLISIRLKGRRGKGLNSLCDVRGKSSIDWQSFVTTCYKSKMAAALFCIIDENGVDGRLHNGMHLKCEKSYISILGAIRHFLGHCVHDVQKHNQKYYV